MIPPKKRRQVLRSYQDNPLCKMLMYMSNGGGQIVSVLVFYVTDPSLNPADANNFHVKFGCPI